MMSTLWPHCGPYIASPTRVELCGGVVESVTSHVHVSCRHLRCDMSHVRFVVMNSSFYGFIMFTVYFFPVHN